MTKQYETQPEKANKMTPQQAALDAVEKFMLAAHNLKRTPNEDKAAVTAAAVKYGDCLEEITKNHMDTIRSALTQARAVDADLMGALRTLFEAHCERRDDIGFEIPVGRVPPGYLMGHYSEAWETVFNVIEGKAPLQSGSLEALLAKVPKDWWWKLSGPDHENEYGFLMMERWGKLDAKEIKAYGPTPTAAIEAAMKLETPKERP